MRCPLPSRLSPIWVVHRYPEAWVGSAWISWGPTSPLPPQLNHEVHVAPADTVPAPTEATYTSEPEKPSVAAPKGVSFPKAISPKFATETPAKGRMHTCLEQYYANKDANTLNGLKWIQKGGGFYSLCNAKLKS